MIDEGMAGYKMHWLNHQLAVYWQQTRCEFLKLVRMRAYILMLSIMPLLLYAGSASNPRIPMQEGIPGRVYLLGSFGIFTLFGIALFGFGLDIALERAQGWTQTMRPAPISPLVPMIAKLLVCMFLSLIALLLLLVFAYVLLDVRLSFVSIGWLIATMLFCSIPLCGVSLAIGSWSGPNSAPLIMIMIYLIISSISGIVVPMEMIQRGNPYLVTIAPIWPTYHAGQLALAVLRPALLSSIVVHVLVLAGYSVLFFMLAFLAQRRNQSLVYG
jgi:ABC-2 type transport system permease protein